MEQLMAPTLNHQHSFYQCLHRLINQQGVALEHIRLQANQSIAFPAQDILLYKAKNSSQPITLTLNFMGMIGVDSPLPHYLLQKTLANNQSSEQLRDFLQLINQRIYQLLFSAWRTARPITEQPASTNRHHTLLNRIAGERLSGAIAQSFKADSAHAHSVKTSAPSSDLDMPWKGYAYAGLMGARIKTAANLKQLISQHLANHPSCKKTQVIQHIQQWKALDHTSRLCPNHLSMDGKSYQLGSTSILGKRVLDSCQTIHVILHFDSYDAGVLFFPQQTAGQTLHRLIKTFIGRLIQLHLQIIVPLTASCQLGNTHHALGYNTKIGNSALKATLNFPETQFC